VVKDYARGRAAVMFRDAAVNTHINSQYMYITPPIPVMDAANFPVELVKTLLGDPDSVRFLAGRSTPWVQAPFVAASERDLFWGKDINLYNRVPPWLVELDRAWTGGAFVDGVLRVQKRPHRDPSKRDVLGHEFDGWYHARNGKAWWAWRNLFQMPMAGRSMDTISSIDRANLGPVEWAVELSRAIRVAGAEAGIIEEVPLLKEKIWKRGEGDTLGPRPDMEWTDEVLTLAGMRPVAVLEGSEARNRIKKKIYQEKMRRAKASGPLSDPSRF